jgi:tripartite-type tricarboxylate transporter receptor subunit TctC
MLLRRHVILHSLAWSAACCVPLPAAAQAAFPSRPIRLVVPNAAGGAADLTARTVGQRISENLGQPVVVDNKPGAGGVVAGETGGPGRAGWPHVAADLQRHGGQRGAVQGAAVRYGQGLHPGRAAGDVRPRHRRPRGRRFRTLGEWVTYAKANPGKLTIGTPNIGTTQHLAAELFKAAAGIDVQIVPFNGTPAVINALRGGQIDAGLDILGPLLAQIRAKTLAPLAITGDKRSRVLPEVPTAKEAGVSGFAAASWNGLAVPAGTPKDVVARLNREVVAALNDPAVSKRLEELNLDPHPGTPEQAAALLNNDIRRWGEVIVRAKIQRQ